MTGQKIFGPRSIIMAWNGPVNGFEAIVAGHGQFEIQNFRRAMYI